MFLTYNQAVEEVLEQVIESGRTHYIHQVGLGEYTVSDIPGTWNCRRVTVEDALAYATPALAAA